MRKFISGRAILMLMPLLLVSCGKNGSGGHGGESDSIICIYPEATFATITFIMPDSTLPRYEVPISRGRNLGKILEAIPGIKVEMKDYPGLGRLVTGINNYRNNEKGDRYWQFCINGVIADKGIDATELEESTEVQWHFVEFNQLPCKKIGE